MTRLAAPLIALVGGLALVGACSSSNFSGTAGKAASDTSTASGTTPTCAGKPCAPGQTPDGPPGTTPGTTPGGTTPPGTTPGGPNACVKGDKVNFEWSGDEKTCIVDQKMTYNFDTKQCAQMRPSQFTCDWATVQAELQKRQLLTDTLKAAATSGNKLVTCGQSQDGSRIVVQWISLADPAANACSFDPAKHHITTGCYTQYAGTPPPPATTEAEKEQQVYSCMNQL